MIGFLGLACAVGLLVSGSLASGHAISADSFHVSTAALVIDSDNGTDFICTGSLIKSNVVLTHVNCIKNFTSQTALKNAGLAVRLGDREPRTLQIAGVGVLDDKDTISKGDMSPVGFVLLKESVSNIPPLELKVTDSLTSVQVRHLDTNDSGNPSVVQQNEYQVIPQSECRKQVPCFNLTENHFCVKARPNGTDKAFMEEGGLGAPVVNSDGIQVGMLGIDRPDCAEGVHMIVNLAPFVDRLLKDMEKLPA